MRAEDSGTWLTGWSPEEPLDLGHHLLRADAAAWEEWPGTGLAGCDLGLAGATRGIAGAQRVRATGEEAHGGDWHCYDLDFEFLYLIAGALTLESQEGDVHELVAGSAFCHPAFYFHRDIFRSGDLDVVRLTSPADGARFDGRDSELPARAAELSPTRSAVYTHEAEDAYAAGTDPDGMASRDLGTAAPTGGRIGMRVVRSPAGGGPGGWHDDTAAEWSMVLRGACRLQVEEDPPERLASGDSFCLGAGSRRRTDRVSPDYAALELWTPARHDAVAVDPPPGADG